jgi:hypothetical protein
MILEQLSLRLGVSKILYLFPEVRYSTGFKAFRHASRPTTPAGMSWTL